VRNDLASERFSCSGDVPVSKQSGVFSKHEELGHFAEPSRHKLGPDGLAMDDGASADGSC